MEQIKDKTGKVRGVILAGPELAVYVAGYNAAIEKIKQAFDLDQEKEPFSGPWRLKIKEESNK